MLLTWMRDAFGFADSFDESEGRYRGLRAGQIVPLTDTDTPGLLVEPEVALKQLEAEKPQPPIGVPPTAPIGGGKERRRPVPAQARPEHLSPHLQRLSRNASTAPYRLIRPAWVATPAISPTKLLPISPD